MTVVTSTIKLNQLSFPSTDIDATARLFERYFGFKGEASGGSRHLKRPGFDIVIDNAESRPGAWQMGLSLGFELPTVADVRELYARFRADGLDVSSGVMRHQRGSTFFFFFNVWAKIEIYTRADAADAIRTRLLSFR